MVALAQAPRELSIVAVADPALLERAAQRVSLPLELDEDLTEPTREPGRLTVQAVPLGAEERPGHLEPANASYVLRTLELAADGCLDGSYGGVVTGPVQKSVINEAGVSFSGHTEFFRDHAGVDDVLMLLVAGSLRVALATTHLPLREVPDRISAALLARKLSLLLDGLREQFRIDRPRVLVAGLNPHAGEGGHLGREEIEVIEPVCERFRARGEAVLGPLPADTLFTQRQLEGAHGVLAMYHDQGLPVLKHAGFGAAVNVTLGLPYLRTSVDHGTALDLAGTGSADPGSLRAALSLAGELLDPA